MLIAVIGGNEAPPDLLALAEEVGRLLAREGCTVICGGRWGIMEAVCRGARSEGGHTIGILPAADRSDMNPYVEFPIVTGIGFARNPIVVLSVVLSGDAVIAIGGSYGTLSEIAHALTFGIPVIGVRTWRFSRDGREDDRIVRAETAEDAVRLALEAARARTQRERTRG